MASDNKSIQEILKEFEPEPVSLTPEEIKKRAQNVEDFWNKLKEILDSNNKILDFESKNEEGRIIGLKIREDIRDSILKVMIKDNLIIAIEAGYHEIIDHLMTDPNYKRLLDDPLCFMLAQYCCYYSQIPSFARLIVNGYRPNPDAVNQTIQYAISTADSTSNPEYLTFLIKYLNIMNIPYDMNYNFNSKKLGECSLLLYSLMHNYDSLTQALLDTQSSTSLLEVHSGIDPNLLPMRVHWIKEIIRKIDNYQESDKAFKLLESLFKAGLKLNELEKGIILYLRCLENIQEPKLIDLILDNISVKDLLYPADPTLNILFEISGHEEYSEQTLQKIIDKGGQEFLKHNANAETALQKILYRMLNDKYDLKIMDFYFKNFMIIISNMVKYGCRITNLKPNQDILPIAIELGFHDQVIQLLKKLGAEHQEVNLEIDKDQENSETDYSKTNLRGLKNSLIPFYILVEFNTPLKQFAECLEEGMDDFFKLPLMREAFRNNKFDELALLVVNGANFTSYMVQLSEDPDFDILKYLELEPHEAPATHFTPQENPYYYHQLFFIKAIKENKEELLKLMLKLTQNFKGEMGVLTLREIIGFAKQHNNSSVVDKLQPALELEEKIVHAYLSGKAMQQKLKLQGPTDDSDLSQAHWLDYQHKKRPLFMRAIAENNQERIIQLVAEGVDPNFPGACYPRELNISEYITIGNEVAIDLNGVVPLKFAGEQKDKEALLQLLLDLGAKPEDANAVQERYHLPPLFQLSNQRNPKLVELSRHEDKKSLDEIQEDDKSPKDKYKPDSP